VQHHVCAVLAQLGVSSRTAAAREAARMGVGGRPGPGGSRSGSSSLAAAAGPGRQSASSQAGRGRAAGGIIRGW